MPKRRRPERKSAQLLDRLSTLFVSGSHSSDAAAISLIFSPDKRLYVVATAQDEREAVSFQAGEPPVSSNSHSLPFVKGARAATGTPGSADERTSGG